jgi:hypothetical protein
MKFSGRFMQAAVDAGSALSKVKRTPISPNVIRSLARTAPQAIRATENAVAHSGAMSAVLPEARLATKALSSAERKFGVCS